MPDDTWLLGYVVGKNNTKKVHTYTLFVVYVNDALNLNTHLV